MSSLNRNRGNRSVVGGKPSTRFSQDAVGNKYLDRRMDAFAAAVRRAEVEADRVAQHGKVRIIVQDGNPGPDA